MTTAWGAWVSASPLGSFAATAGPAFAVTVSVIELPTRFAIHAPQMAVPTAMPTCRLVLLMPEAIPERRTSTTPTAVDAKRGVRDADADTADDQAGQQRRPVRAAIDRRHEQQADADEPETGPSIAPGGTFGKSFPATGAAKNDRSVDGRKRRPASSGE